MINYKRHRKTIEKLYDGECTVKVHGEYQDPVTKITKVGEHTLFEKQPCRLSYGSMPSTSDTEGPANIVQITKLFIAPELEIPAGSKIIVTQNGRTTEFSNSGVPAVYPTHQEITLELFKEYA